MLSSYHSVGELWLPEITHSVAHVVTSPLKTETEPALMWPPHEVTSFVVGCQDLNILGARREVLSASLMPSMTNILGILRLDEQHPPCELKMVWGT